MWKFFYDFKSIKTKDILVPKDLLEVDFLPNINLYTKLNKKYIEGFVHLEIKYEKQMNI